MRKWTNRGTAALSSTAGGVRPERTVAKLCAAAAVALPLALAPPAVARGKGGGSETPILSGYGGPGAGEQVILGSELLPEHGGRPTGGRLAPASGSGAALGQRPTQGESQAGQARGQQGRQGRSRSSEGGSGVVAGGPGRPGGGPPGPSRAGGVSQRSGGSDKVDLTVKGGSSGFEGGLVGLVVGVFVALLALAWATRRLARGRPPGELGQGWGKVEGG